MAFAPAGFRESDIDRVLDLVKPVSYIEKVEHPVCLNGPNGLVPFTTIPTRPSDSATFVRSMLDWIENHPGFDTVDVFQKLRNRQYDQLPDILKPRADPAQPIKMQLVVLSNADGTHNILKHYLFKNRCAVNIAKDMCFGAPLELKLLSPNPTLSKKAFQWLFEQMGGLQALWFQLKPPQEDIEEIKAIDEGYDFIDKHGPTDASEFERLRWVSKWTHKNHPSSPIKDWRTATVEKALQAKRNLGSLAKIRKELPINLTGFDRFFLKHAIVPILKYLVDHGLVMLGVNNMGKTPVALAVALMFARHYIQKFGFDAEAQLRSAPDLDFFRGDPGHIFQPFVLDDGDLNVQDIRKLKAFLDVSEEEALTYQRWGGAKFIRNQLRIAIDNKHDDSVETQMNDIFPGNERQIVPSNLFYDLIRPAFKKDTTVPDLEAILKRACFIVITKSYFYVKIAAQPLVYRFRVPASLLTTEAGQRYIEWKRNGTMPPANVLRSEIDIEQRFLQRALQGEEAQGEFVGPPRRWAAGSLFQQG